MDSRFARIRTLKDKKRRFNEVWKLAKDKKTCEQSPAEDDEEVNLMRGKFRFKQTIQAGLGREFVEKDPQT